MTSIKSKVWTNAVAALLAIGATAAQAGTIQITSRDAAGVGFNDPTPVAPVGGNTGTTLGEQRMIVYRHVADLWEQALQSNVPITVSAGWQALTCTATGAVLGSAGAWNIWYDFPGGAAGTWYPQALANKLAGVNLSAGVPDDGSGFGTVDIKTQFNVNLGKPDCLAGAPFYLGLDGNSGTGVNFVETLLHELGHGLGFSVLSVQTSTGKRLNAAADAYVADGGLPSIWEGHMYDNLAGKTWLVMSSDERKASAVNPRQLVWTGSNVTTSAPSVLSYGTPRMQVLWPAAIAGEYLAGAAAFGPALDSPGLTRQVMPVVEGANLGLACAALDAANQTAVRKRIALVLRGTCPFTQKVLNAQNAGALGVIVIDNTTATPPDSLGGADARVTIPAIRVSFADGVTLLSAMNLAKRSSDVVVRLGVDSSQLAGADKLGRVMLYTPNPLVGGSSVSHWDTSARRNLLMEPSINADLTPFVVPPYDLTLPLLKDLGW